MIDFGLLQQCYCRTKTPVVLRRVDW